MADLKPLAGIAKDDSLGAILNELSMRLSDIADSVGNLMPDVAGRLRVNAEAVANIATITTVSTVTTVTTVGSVTNQANIGGMAANQHMPFLSQINETQLRQNVVIS